jgi:ABC-type xylose transport system permease subunit
MGLFEHEDTLELLGILFGAFVVVVGLGSLAGTPWTTTEKTTAVAVQTAGIFLTIAVGVVLVLVAYTGELSVDSVR